MFYEKVNAGHDAFFYIRWHSTLLSNGKAGGYGTRSSTSAIDNIGQINGNSGLYKLKVNEEYNATPHNSYFLKVRNSFKSFSSADTLAKLYKGHTEEIKEYAKAENIDFNNPEDVKKAVAYCATIGK
jgi:hypothetical protein